jgi:hypothetical protein
MLLRQDLVLQTDAQSTKVNPALSRCGPKGDQRGNDVGKISTSGGTRADQHDCPKCYLSVKQVVERLNHAISIKLVYKLIAAGKLKANRATGKILVKADSLDELMGEQRPAATVPQQPPPTEPQVSKAPQSVACS